MLPVPVFCGRGENAFTLMELLITLMILGEIAVFTLPKVLIAQQNTKANAAAKEAAATISHSYILYKMSNSPDAAMNSNMLTQYMNYVSVRTTSNIDAREGSASSNCVSSTPCMVLHNGGVIRTSNVTFNGTGTTNAIEFLFDPDGVYGGSTTGPSKSVQFLLYLNGRITSRNGATAGTINSTGNTYDPDTTLDPSWLSW